MLLRFGKERELKMKSLKDHDINVKGVEVISASEFRRHIGECLTLASLGKTYCIKRKGDIVAYLTLSADISHDVKSDGTCETADF